LSSIGVNVMGTPSPAPSKLTAV